MKLRLSKRRFNTVGSFAAALIIATMFTSCVFNKGYRLIYYGSGNTLRSSKKLKELIEGLPTVEVSTQKANKAIDSLNNTNEGDFKASYKDMRHFDRKVRRYTRRLNRIKAVVVRRNFPKKFFDELNSTQKELDNKTAISRGTKTVQASAENASKSETTDQKFLSNDTAKGGKGKASEQKAGAKYVVDKNGVKAGDTEKAADSDSVVLAKAEASCECQDYWMTVCTALGLVKNYSDELQQLRKQASKNTSNMDVLTTLANSGLLKDSAKKQLNAVKSNSSQIQEYMQDSAKYQNIIKGAQQTSLSLALFQNFSNVGNDDPSSYTAYHVNLSIPLNRIDGKIGCQGNTWIWFRNLYMEFMDAPGNKALGATAYSDTVKKINYVNNMDLYQYASLRAALNFNIFTVVNTPVTNGPFSGDRMSFYFDLFAGINRTTLFKKANDTLFSTNAGVYGINATYIARFHSNPITTIFNGQLFWIDPNTNSFIPGLNAQYKMLNYAKPATPYLSNSQIYPYGSLALTIQYNIGSGSSAASTKTPNSSSNSSTSPNFLYAYIQYTSSMMFGNGKGLFGIFGPNQRVHNNFVSVMLGYSIDISTVLKALESLAGVKSSDSSTSSSGGSGSTKKNG